MKKIVLLFIAIIFLSAYFYSTKVAVYGKVSNKETGELIPFATVVASQDGQVITGSDTNLNGEYTLNIEPGEYEFEASFIGFNSTSEKRKVKNNSPQELNFEISEGSVLKEVVIHGLAIEKEERSLGYSIDKIDVIKFKSSSIIIESSDDYSETSSVSPTHEEALPEAGQITAAEWNDLHNWEEWNELLENEDYQEMQNHWSLFPNERYAVFITNEYKFPIPNCQVSLFSKKGTMIWSARTDVHGKAELWNNLNQEETEADHIVVEYQSIQRKIEGIKSIEEGTNQLSLNISCPEKVQTEIMFVVDATGSMGDEISFLQSELSDVLYQCSSLRNIENIKVGSVFYRDHYEDYLTRVSPLSDDLDLTVQFIEEQSAAGGGDFPEAVDIALEKAVSQNWNPTAANKIIFLLLDAPPHADDESMNSIRAQIKLAAEKGIKIVPITASGITRETEFLMKFMAMATNGTYVFITDDSGIGNAHLAPVVQDFEVEKLNDLIVRLIKEYSNLTTCESDDQPIINTDLSWKFFPNPAKSIVNIEISQDVDAIYVRSASGKIVYQEVSKNRGTHQINLGQLVSGVYTLTLRTGDQNYSKKLILIDR